jgi:hypothetical protein
MPKKPTERQAKNTPSVDRAEYLKQYREAKRRDGVRRVSVTLTPEEYRTLKARAKAVGIRPTSLARELVTSPHGIPATPPEAIATELQELRFLLRNVANNINQIAHHSNTIKRLVDENGLLLEIRKMEEAVSSWVEEKRHPQ